MVSGTDNWENKQFHTSFYNFEGHALELFRFQYEHNPVYRKFTDSINVDPLMVNRIERIPFLPVQLFKRCEVRTTEFVPEIIFESSGTTGVEKSRHALKDVSLYKNTLLTGFELFYGVPSDWCIIGLLPSYLERKGSSLVFMVEQLQLQSDHELSGFYLSDHEKLYHTLLHNEIRGQQTILIGVSFALLDFAEKYQMKLSCTTIIETGGMKGRRDEITRGELHTTLSKAFGISTLHSEYGMTELLSQAYSKKDGVYKCPPWMQIFTRDEDDPFKVHGAPKTKLPVTGMLNIIDLANVYSCAFLATDDIGKLHHNGCFEVMGRSDASEARGCSQMVI